VTAATYLDSSAIAKLAAAEPPSIALRAHLRRRRSAMSRRLATAEVLRALLVAGDEAVPRGRAVLSRVVPVRLGDRILAVARTLLPTTVGALDALRLATALDPGSDLVRVVTYDMRTAEGARHLDLRPNNRARTDCRRSPPDAPAPGGRAKPCVKRGPLLTG
jgi:predicted nucleic acid-binding protein